MLKKCLLIAKMQSNHCKMIFSEPPKPTMRLYPGTFLVGGLGEGFRLSESSFFTLKCRQQESRGQGDLIQEAHVNRPPETSP